MKIEEIIKQGDKPEEIMARLTKKIAKVPEWSKLELEYNPEKHPVMTDTSYQDTINDEGLVEKRTQITLDLQRLAVKRMAEMTFGIPVKRIYNAETESEKKVAKIMERIFVRNRIDSLNIERAKMLFASCEVLTIWYGVEQESMIYGEKSKLKLRCKNYSPMDGYELYPLLDETDDMVAMSIAYSKKEGEKTISYFDVYTAESHLRFEKREQWEETIREAISTMMIPAIYIYRESPIWETTSGLVSEIEWTLSRNGNYIRRNSKPIFALFADEEVETGMEKDDSYRSVFQYPKGSDAKYITWEQGTESIKLQIEQLYRAFHTQLQLPDVSHENMKSSNMSEESRKMMFIDAQLKVKDESGRLLEFLDREVNVVKGYMKIMFPNLTKAIDTLQVEQVITPFMVSDEKETINNLTTATGGKAILSQLEAVKLLGLVDNPEEEIAQLKKEETVSVFESAE